MLDEPELESVAVIAMAEANAGPGTASLTDTAALAESATLAGVIIGRGRNSRRLSDDLGAYRRAGASCRTWDELGRSGLAD
jgi:hypothetical protein